MVRTPESLPDQARSQPPERPELKLEGRDWVLPSDPAVLPMVRVELERRFREAGWPEEAWSRLLLGVEEAITNAIERGNLEVPTKSSFTDDDPGAYPRAIAQAMASERGARRVAVSVDIIPTLAEFVVQDEGSGFVPNSLPDPTSEAELAKRRASGRGVFLMRAAFGPDGVQYNEVGNQVRLSKRRSPA